MTKKVFILALSLFLSLSTYSQSIFFEKNVNHKARNLKQNLSEKRDTLVLESTKDPISQVDILKEDFLKSIDVRSNIAKVGLDELPIGNYIIQARVNNKRIVMYLEKRLEVDESLIDNEVEVSDLDKLETPEIKRPNDISKKEKVLYWVVYETNSNFGSRKFMRLETKEEVAKLISKNKLELKSKIARNNRLVVYEIYDTSKFMKRQLRNPDYYKSKHSRVFNEDPFYSSLDQMKPKP